MKAERRHELQKNSLATVLQDLPLYLRFYANYILIGVIVICGIVLLVRHRRNTATQAAMLSQESVLAARIGVGQLSQVDAMQGSEIGRITERNKLESDIRNNVQQVLDNTTEQDNPALRARAFLARADMSWELANLPELPGATTMPNAIAASKYLENAHDDYLTIVNNYPNQPITRAAALFGLAAVEENRRDWDKAKQFYQQAVDDAAIPAMFKSIATQRISLLPQLHDPVYLGSFSSTQPTTDESSTQPTSDESITTSMPAMDVPAAPEAIDTTAAGPTTGPAGE